MQRQEHLDWAKARALEYIDQGDTRQAFTSMVSDLNKHEELRKFHELTNQLGMQQLTAGMLDSPEAMRRWITGYN